MEEKIKSILEVGIKPITIFITSILTIIFGVSINFEVCPFFKVAFGIGFYFSLSLILIEILIQQYFIREKYSDIVHQKTEPIKADTTKIAKDTKVLCDHTGCIKETTLELNKKIKSWDSLLLPAEESYAINDRVVKIFKNNKESKMKMKIICYGTNKYGGLVDMIKRIHNNTKFEIIVCSNNSPFLNNLQGEKSALETTINAMAKDTNITLYASMIPPTIRASLISKEIESNKEHYVWCSIQPYYMFNDDDGKLFRGENFSPTIVADEKSFILSDLENIFNTEFNRLSALSTLDPKVPTS